MESWLREKWVTSFCGNTEEQKGVGDKASRQLEPYFKDLSMPGQEIYVKCDKREKMVWIQGGEGYRPGDIQLWNTI